MFIMIRNLIFDFDGTIADSMDEMLKIVNDNAEKYGFKRLSHKKIRFLMGKGAKYLINYLKVPKYKIPFLMQELREKISSKVPDLKPFESIPMTLKKLHKRKFRLGILTSNSRDNVEIFLKNKSLEVFDFIYHGSSLFGKDRMLNKMLKEQKLEKSETAYVGDEDRDLEAAKKVGLTSIAVTWGFNSKKLLQSVKPDYLIEKPKDILSVINK